MSGTTAPDRNTKHIDSLPGWQTVAASVVVLCFGPSALLVLCFGSFVQQWHQDFGWSVGQIALGGSIISVMIMITSPLQGWAADRIGARSILLFSIPVWALSVASMAALPPSLPVFYLFCVLLPLCGFGVWPLVQMKILTTWFDKHLGLALGLANTGLGVGAILLPILLQIIFDHSGWRAAYLWLSATIVLLVLPVAVWKMREYDGPAEDGMPSIDKVQDAKEAWKSPSFLRTACAFLMLGGISSALLINFVSVLVASGFSSDQAVKTQALLGIGSIAGRIGAGWLLDHIQARWVGLGLALIAALACLLLTSPAIAIWSAAPAAAAICLGLLIGSEFDLLGVVIRRNHGLKAFGRLFGIVFAVFQLGAAVGISALALSADVLHGYTIGLLALSALALVAGALLCRLRSEAAYRPRPVPSCLTVADAAR